MTKDEHLKAGEQDYAEARESLIDRDAAVFVEQHWSRSEASRKAMAISVAQEEAENDLTGTLSTLAEAQSPMVPAGKEAQVRAISRSLREARG